MDIDYHVESALIDVLSNFSAPASASSSYTSPTVVVSATSSPVSALHPLQSTVSSSLHPLQSTVPSSNGLSSSSSLEATTTSTLEAGQKKLLEGLEEAARIFKEASRPSVVIVNQVPPSSAPPMAWHQDPDLPAVGAAVGFLLLVVLVAGCFWLRRFRPSVWERVKAAGWRLATWVALPLSWLCGRAAVLLRHLHDSAEGQQGTSTSTVQVGETDSF